jgi:hypothetical protein
MTHQPTARGCVQAIRRSPQREEQSATGSRNRYNGNDRLRELQEWAATGRPPMRHWGQLDWIVGYLHKIRRGDIARALDRNRKQIIEEMRARQPHVALAGEADCPPRNAPLSEVLKRCGAADFRRPEARRAATRRHRPKAHLLHDRGREELPSSTPLRTPTTLLPGTSSRTPADAPLRDASA